MSNPSAGRGSVTADAAQPQRPTPFPDREAQLTRPIFVAGASSTTTAPTGRPEDVAEARGRLEVESDVLAGIARRLERASEEVASTTSDAPAEVDAGEQTALVVRLLERLVTASAEVSRGLEAGGRAVVQVGRGVQDVDDDVSRRHLTRKSEEER